MRAASAIVDSRAVSGRIEDDAFHPFADAGPLGAATDFAALASHPVGAPLPLAEVRLLPVVPDPRKIICLGVNYKGHAAETGRELPTYPILFTKFADALIGPSDPIAKPPETERLDFEAELCVVIGRSGRRIAAARALDHVAGYTVANDVTARDYQRRSSQWLQGKSWPRTTPVGPWLVTADELGDGSGLAISTSVNGREMQRADTGQMIFDVATAIATISEFTELGPGDLILMGTPEGVGDKREPPVYLVPGDTVRVEIEGIGAVENPVEADPGA